ncbi:MAG: helix-turn-helix domain-containing protein [Terracidiphilus sp.]
MTIIPFVPQSLPLENYLDAKQLGKILSFHPRTLRRMAHNGDIPSLSVSNGGRVYYRFQLSAVEEALSSGD